MTSELRDVICPPGSGGGWATSDDGTATAVPLGVIDRIHSVVCAIDVVDVSLSLVPVMHFCEGDQLNGLALGKQWAKKNFSVLFKSLACSRTFSSSLLPRR